MAVLAILILAGSIPCMADCTLADSVQKDTAPCGCHHRGMPGGTMKIACHRDVVAPAPPTGLGPHQSRVLAAPVVVARAIDLRFSCPWRVTRPDQPPGGAHPPLSVLRI
jgi:hypothetical protein